MIGNPFIGEIGMFAGSFAPQGWLLCNGKSLARSRHATLAKILNDKYGTNVDDRGKFALPDLRGRVAIHAGNGPGLSEYKLGMPGGTETVELTKENLPEWSHSISTYSPSLKEVYQAEFKPGNFALLATELEKNGSITLGESKKAKAFSIIQPYTTINYIVAGHGVFPVASKKGYGTSSVDAMIGEIRMFSGDFAPSGWAFCDGQKLSITQHPEFFSVIGTIFGGDGRTTFGLPDLRGRAPVHPAKYMSFGSRSGNETTTLLNRNIPRTASTIPTFSPGLDDRDRPDFKNGYSAFLSTDLPNNNQFLLEVGGEGKAFPNMQPYLPVRFIICMDGKYPSRN